MQNEVSGFENHYLERQKEGHDLSFKLVQRDAEGKHVPSGIHKGVIVELQDKCHSV